MNILKSALVLGCCTLVAACGEGGYGKVDTDKTIDYGFRKKAPEPACGRYLG